MASKYSTGAIISSIFKKFVNEYLTPEFIRDEANRLCDALGIDHVGDPGKVTRDFKSSQAVQKNADKAEYYWFNPEECHDDIFLQYDNLYDDSFFNPQMYEALKYMDSLRSSMLKNPTNNVNTVLEKLGLKIADISQGTIDKSYKGKECPPLKYPSQIIYYGVPGCGKSNKIREQLKNVPEKNKVRVVFHPEYTNAEFIGQILPVTNDGIRYEFTPGPFTQIIKRAYLNPNEQFYLVIEEINRGNAAAIFGDTFQLLDRLKAGETDSLGNDPANAAVNTFTEGWSQYFVQNDDVNAYIRKTTKLDDGSYQERNDGEPIEEIKIKEIHFNANTAIRLPPNLSILATMNTSDQNVFTLDNAFQRRFDMELVRNEFELATNDDDKSKYGGFKTTDIQTQHDAKIADTDIKWGDFWEWINKKIVSTLKGLSSTEDKRLGVWFVSNVDGKIEGKIFAEKVLKYLWDEVFKFKRPQVFASDIDTLEKLIALFENPEQGKSRFAVFKEIPNLGSSVAEPSQNEGSANQ